MPACLALIAAIKERLEPDRIGKAIAAPSLDVPALTNKGILGHFDRTRRASSSVFPASLTILFDEEKMCRVTIIGNAAGGKSTICKAIVRRHKLPLHPVDKIQWKPGWVAAPAKAVASEIRKVIVQDKWLLDGWGPWETIEERFEKADTIIFIDHSVWIHLYWALKRQLKALSIRSP